jgi:hypothetical protein
MLMDGGGSNSSRHYIFKQDLQALVDELGIYIRVAHYPPYTSKWNPIEHRVFPHMTRTLQGTLNRAPYAALAGRILKTAMQIAVPKGLNHLPDDLLQQAIEALR